MYVLAMMEIVNVLDAPTQVDDLVQKCLMNVRFSQSSYLLLALLNTYSYGNAELRATEEMAQFHLPLQRKLDLESSYPEKLNQTLFWIKMSCDEFDQVATFLPFDLDRYVQRDSGGSLTYFIRKDFSLLLLGASWTVPCATGSGKCFQKSPNILQ